MIDSLNDFTAPDWTEAATKLYELNPIVDHTACDIDSLFFMLNTYHRNREVVGSLLLFEPASSNNKTKSL